MASKVILVVNPVASIFPRGLLAVVICLFTGAAIAGDGKDLPDPPLFRDALQAGWLDFDVVWGHIEVIPRRIGTIEYEDSKSGRVERLALSCTATDCALDYCLTGRRGRLAMVARRSGELQFDWTPSRATGGPEVCFAQPAQAGELVLTVSEAGHCQRFAARTLWHLWIVDREAADRHLSPMLHLILPHRQPGVLVPRVESSLLATAAQGQAPPRAEWEALVDGLADDSYDAREAADRAMRQIGPALLWYLAEADLSSWDAEQRFRVRRIRQALLSSPPDVVPERTAAWLAGDRELWEVLKASHDADKRRCAEAALGAMQGE